MQIVDSHQHFWQVGRFDYPWMSSEVPILHQDYLPPALQPILERNGIARTVLVQASNSLAETRWLLSLADDYPFIAGVVGWVDLMDPELEQSLTEFTGNPKFKGVRHLVESEPVDDWLVQPAVIKGLQTLASQKLTYDLLVHPRHLQHARSVAESCPELALVIVHMAKPPIARGEISEWLPKLKDVSRFPNVYCKLSGLVTEANHSSWKLEDLRPFVEAALELFGPGRMMFGSDYPVCLLAASYDRVLESFQELLKDLGDNDRSLVFGKNATEFYRLSHTVFS